jgi:hypothetical protein
MVLTGVSCPWPEDRTLTKPPPKPANATNSMNLCNECYDSIHGRTTNADICCIWPRKDLPSIYCYLQILNYSTIFIIAIIQYNITIRTIHTQSPQGLFSCWHCSILEPFGKSTIWVQNTATLHTVHAFVHVNLLCPLCLQFEQTISWCFGSLIFCLRGIPADSVFAWVAPKPFDSGVKLSGNSAWSLCLSTFQDLAGPGIQKKWQKVWSSCLRRNREWVVKFTKVYLSKCHFVYSCNV